MTTDIKPVPLTEKLYYSLPGLVLAAAGVPLYIYIPKFYTDVVGVSAAAMGGLILAARLTDAATDPLVGVISDRTKTRFGRRRPYIALGSFALAGLMAGIYFPPQGDSLFVTLWFGITIIGLSLAWTLVDVPWESLGPEITKNYDERTTLFSLREGITILGAILAVATPPILKWLGGLSDSPYDQRLKFAWFGAIYAPLILICCWLMVLKVKEKPLDTKTLTREPNQIWRNWRQTFANRPFRILLAAYAVAAIGANLPATLILYYVEYVLGGKNAEIFIFIYVLTGILFLPVWLHASRKMDKKRAWITAMLINTGAFLGVFFLGEGDLVAYGLLTLVSGAGFGASLVLPTSMQADIIDMDEFLHNKRREGRFIGVWSVVKKASSAVGMGLALPILEMSGYEPGVKQNQQTIFALRMLYCLAPCVCSFGAIAIALYYPLSRKRHQALLKAIAKRKQLKTREDPLTPPKMALKQNGGA
jgi:GPH family glycoside/pentoside/hexuronide:cation symporter